MNYKHIITSRNIRLKILRMFDWIPDSIMIPLQYRIHTGRKLNTLNPKRFTEKIQVYKLRYRNPLMLRSTDKLEVRKVIEEAGYEDILIPLYKTFNNSEDVDFNTLPESFVIKTTDGGGGNQVLICREKSKINKDNFYSTIKGWMNAPKTKKSSGREWAYTNGYPRRLIVEQLISNNKDTDLTDYKFYCFNGEPKYCQIISNRSTDERIDFYDMEWKHMPFRGLNPLPKFADKPLSKPQLLNEMIEIARKLSKPFPFVRVDLYDDGKKIWFGELTFYPASGLGHFSPDEWDYKLGSLLQLPE